MIGVMDKMLGKHPMDLMIGRKPLRIPFRTLGLGKEIGKKRRKKGRKRKRSRRRSETNMNRRKGIPIMIEEEIAVNRLGMEMLQIGGVSPGRVSTIVVVHLQVRGLLGPATEVESRIDDSGDSVRLPIHRPPLLHQVALLHPPLPAVPAPLGLGARERVIEGVEWITRRM